MLSEPDLREFIAILRDLFGHVETVRNASSLGRHIKRLQVPSVVSESLAALLLSSGHFGRRMAVAESATGGDLEIATATGVPARFEVKATTEAGFQQLGPKDIAADLLLWIHYDDFFWNQATTEISVIFLAKPGDVFKAPRKIGLPKFIEVAGDRALVREVNLKQFLSPESQPADQAQGGRDA